jgi:hypothetical protein
MFYKLWSADLRWSPTVRQAAPGGFGGKRIVKIVSDTERKRNTPTHVCAKLPLLVDHQQKVGELVLSINSYPQSLL